LYRLRSRLTILALLLAFVLGCASGPGEAPTRRISELEDFGGSVAEAAELIQDGGDNEAERLELLGRLSVALAVRGDDEAATEAAAIGTQGLIRLSEEPVVASRLAAELAETYARLELAEPAANRLERSRRFALETEDEVTRARLLTNLVITAARGEGAYADATRAALDEIYVLQDPVLRSRTILDVAAALSRRNVNLDVANLLQQSIPAAAEIGNPYIQGARYTRISALFRELGDFSSALATEEKGVETVLRTAEPLEEVSELQAIGEVVGHLRRRGLIGEALQVARRIPLESRRALETARLAREAQSRGESGRARDIAEEAQSLIGRVQGRPAEVLTAQALLARLYRDYAELERAERLLGRVIASLRDAPATPTYREPFLQVLLYRIDAEEVGTLGEIVALSDSADFRAMLLVTLAEGEELQEDDRLQAGVLRQAAGEDPRELSRETQLALIEGFLRRELLNEALRLLEESGDPYVRAAGYIEVLRLFPNYPGPI
jgi:hypothetical protein